MRNYVGIRNAEVHGIPKSVCFDVVEYLWGINVRTHFYENPGWFSPRIIINCFDREYNEHQEHFSSLQSLKDFLMELDDVSLDTKLIGRITK